MHSNPFHSTYQIQCDAHVFVMDRVVIAAILGHRHRLIVVRGAHACLLFGQGSVDLILWSAQLPDCGQSDSFFFSV